MIILVREDGRPECFFKSKMEIINSEIIRLVGTEPESFNYFVSAKDIETKLRDGGCEYRLPMIYDSDLHGVLTNESFVKYGVPVTIW